MLRWPCLTHAPLVVCLAAGSLPRRQVLHRVKGKVWNYLLTKKEKEWESQL